MVDIFTLRENIFRQLRLCLSINDVITDSASPRPAGVLRFVGSGPGSTCRVQQLDPGSGLCEDVDSTVPDCPVSSVSFGHQPEVQAWPPSWISFPSSWGGLAEVLSIQTLRLLLLL